MMDLFQKLKYGRLAFLKKLTYLKTQYLKILEFYNKMMEGSKIEWVFVFNEFVNSSLKSFHSSVVSLWKCSFIEMCYAKLENKTS